MPVALVGYVFGAAFAASVAGQVVAGIIGIGLSIGLQMLSQALFGPKTPKPEDQQNVIRQSVTPRVWLRGEGRLGGSLAFVETNDGRVLHMVQMHCQGPVTEYTDELYIDQRLVTVDGTGPNPWDGGITTSPYEPDEQRVFSHVGTYDQAADAVMIANFPTLWGADYRLREIAYSVLRCDPVDDEEVGKIYPNRIPLFNRIIRGNAIFDPRDDSTIYSKNAALILRDYLTLQDGGLAFAEAIIDDTTFSQAADDSADPIALKAGGTVPRYDIGLSWNSEAEPASVIGRIVTATDGRVYLTSEGKIGFNVGKFVTPTVTIDDDLGHLTHIELTDGSGPFDEVNEVIVKFTLVEAGHKQATSDPWRDQDSIDVIGLKSEVLESYEIQTHNHARRMAKIIEHRASPRWKGTLKTTLHGLNAWDQRWINLKIPYLEIDAVFEIIGPPQFDTDEMSIAFEVQMFDETIYDFDAATEEGDGPTITESEDEKPTPEPENVETSYEKRGTSEDDEGKTFDLYVGVITWDIPETKDLTGVAEYSVDGSAYRAMFVGTQENRAETPVVNPGALIEMRVRFRSIGGTYSNFVDGDPITLPGVAPVITSDLMLGSDYIALGVDQLSLG